MDAIKNWFENRDYEMGVVLLARYCKNRILINNLTRKPNPDKLEYELRKLAKRDGKELKEISRQKVVYVPSGKKAAPTGDSNPFSRGLTIVKNERTIKLDELPVDIRALWEVNRDAYKEVRSLHEKLKLMEKATDEDRRPLVARVIELDNMIRANWKIIDDWNPERESEEKKETDESVIVKIKNMLSYNRVNSNRKYISSGLKRLRKGKADDTITARIKSEILVRYNELKATGIEMSPETIEAIKSFGIQIV